ncbi:hypothetical protein ACS0TY_006554 [Phlomoides rotata]
MQLAFPPEIKDRFRYHPDENANDVKAANVFKEVTFSYNILSDSDKRRQYYTSGFEVNLSELSLVYEILTISNFSVYFFSAVESERQELEVELDLSSLGTVNTMFAAIFSKLGVPIKSTISATVLEEALNGAVEKQCAHFYSIAITEKGSACRIFFAEFIHQTSKFKVLAQLTEMTSRYAQEMQARNEIHASYATVPQIRRSSSSRSKNKATFKDCEKGVGKEKKYSRKRSKKKRWYNIHLKDLKVDKKKPCGME